MSRLVYTSPWSNQADIPEVVETELRRKVIEELERLIDEIGALHTKLVLLIGASGSGKTQLLRTLGKRRNTVPLNVGVTLGTGLAAVSQSQRQIQANGMLREFAKTCADSDLLLIDNLEILFDHSLKLDPLGVLKQQAHARRVVAVWPGELRDGRLKYAEMGHPEYQDYGIEGFVPFQIQ